MLRAVTFDWGDTLMRDEWSEEVVQEGLAAGLAALAHRDDLPDAEALSAWWNEPGRPHLDDRREDEIEMLALQRRLFSELGCELADEEVRAYYEAFHRTWARGLALSQHAYALLEALRNRRLRIGIVSNVGTPGYLVRRLLDEQGLTQRVDSVVLSCEVGKRKPHPAIFERALMELGAEPHEALHVGDRRHHDVGGARAAGMRTMLALWFRAEDETEGPDADYEAFTMFDVLNVVDRLAA